MATTNIVTLYDDSAKTIAFAPRTKVEAISDSDNTPLTDLLAGKMDADNNKFTNGIEVHHATSPFIDFHYTSNQGDYTTRIIESSANTLDIVAKTNDSNNTSTTAILKVNGTAVSLDGHTHAKLVNANGREVNLSYDSSSGNYFFRPNESNNDTSLGSAARPWRNLYLNSTGTGIYLSTGGDNATTTQLSVAELGYLNGVTSSIQTQLDGKAASSHTHSYLPLSGGTLTGNLTVNGTLTTKGGAFEFYGTSTTPTAYIDFHYNASTADYTSRIIESASGTLAVNGVSFSSSKITSGTWNGSVIGAAYGGTGKTTLADSANALINALSTDSSTPVDADYYVAQYAGGGTTTTTYRRRPVSALWTYIKGKADSTYAAASHNHAASAITSGTLAIARGGTAASTAAAARKNLGAPTVFITSSTPTANATGDIWFIP